MENEKGRAELLQKNYDFASRGEFSSLKGWQFHSVEDQPDGKVIEYSFCSIYRSGVSRGILVGQDGIENVAYYSDPKSTQLCDKRAKASLEIGLGYSPF